MPIRREVNTLSGVTSYASFFSAAASVAGALTGLLFVALSIRPQRLRGGGEGSLEHQAIAATAFTALIDALFVSLAGLTPGGGTTLASLIMGLIGLTSSAGLAARLWRARGAEALSQRWPYLLTLILAMYLAQVILALADHARQIRGGEDRHRAAVRNGEEPAIRSYRQDRWRIRDADGAGDLARSCV
jgi:hypothetical protein